MSLFRRLFGARRPLHLEDGIWLTTTAKHRGIQRIAEEAINGNTPSLAIILAHFPSTLEHLQADTELPEAAEVMLVRDALQLDVNTAWSSRANDQPIQVMVAERHLARHFDEGIAEQMALLPNASLRFHLSLEDPLLQSFTGPWLQSTLSSMGANEEDMIESSMIGRRLEQAQRKICQGIEHEDQTLNAASPEEWLTINGRQR